jgi:hypothetical protein
MAPAGLRALAWCALLVLVAAATTAPTDLPTLAPTVLPTLGPSDAPTAEPTAKPTASTDNAFVALGKSLSPVALW